MEEVIVGYQRLLQLLDDERESACRCMAGQYLQTYLTIIEQEMEKIQIELRLLNNKFI